MAGLWAVLWPNWGLFWDPFVDVSWLVCGMFYGLIGDCFGVVLCPVLWLVCGLFCGLNWDCFGTILCPVLWPICGLSCGRLGLFCNTPNYTLTHV